MAWLKTLTQGGVRSIAGLGLAVILFVAVNVLAGATLTGTRLDLTQDRLFTLSPGTLETLKAIDEPITLRFFYSDELGRQVPSYVGYAQRVRDMLQEIANLGGAKVHLEVYNPEPFSAAEDRAVALELQGVPIDQGGELVYFGLAGTNSVDDLVVVPFFQPERERFLEYDLAKMVYKLAHPEGTVVGLLSSLPVEGDYRAAMMGQKMQPWTFMEQVQQLFDVHPLTTLIDAVPDDVDVLLVIHPTKLPQKTLYAIDQFILAGGRALIFVDPLSETGLIEGARSQQTIPAASDLKPLFDAWGISMSEDKVVGDRLQARRVNAGTGNRVRAMDYIAWLQVQPQNLDRDDVVTGQLQLLNMATVGALEQSADSTLTMQPLIWSSLNASEVDAQPLRFRPDIEGLLANFKSDNKSYIIAARLTGKVKSAFPDGPPPDKKSDKPKVVGEKDPDNPGAGDAADKETKATKPHLTESTGPISVILVADTDMLADRFWVQSQDFFGQRVVVPTANNGDFVTNALDSLSGSDALISLRGRGVAYRPFERVQALQRAAEQRLRGTELDLQRKLKETQNKLSALQTVEGGGEPGAAPREASVIVTPEQQKEIDKFRREVISINHQLRDVQHALRRDIERLEAEVKFVNIGLIPLIVGVLAIVLGAVRLARRRHHAGA